MVSDEAIRNAIELGRRQAETVISFRYRELKKRAVAIAARTKKARRTRSAEARVGTVKRLGPPARDVLIAEGDSWFDYPFHDVLRILEDHYGYEIESIAHKGDRVEEMAYSDGQLEEFARRLEKLLRRRTVPRAILLSGGGNDVTGKEFGMLLNHYASGIAGLNSSVVDGVINERIRLAYAAIISKVTSVCRLRLGQTLPIIVHGYDYPVPDGRGYSGGWWILPGPWLEPGFREKGFIHRKQRIDIAKELMDRFNVMLSEVASMPEFGHVHYVDLRGTLSVSEDYKDDWANELHPTEKGFRRITKRFARTIDELPQL